MAYLQIKGSFDDLSPGNPPVESTLVEQCPVLMTSRLILRPPHNNDIDDIVRLVNNPKVALMLDSIIFPYSRKDAENFLENLSNTASQSTYSITRTNDGKFMGICSLHAPGGTYELSYARYWLGEEFWNKGYASEAVRALVDLFFKVTKCDKMQISCTSKNRNALRVIEKCGGKYWKDGKTFFKSINRVHTIEHYLITRENWIEAVTV